MWDLTNIRWDIKSRKNLVQKLNSPSVGSTQLLGGGPLSPPGIAEVETRDSPVEYYGMLLVNVYESGGGITTHKQRRIEPQRLRMRAASYGYAHISFLWWDGGMSGHELGAHGHRFRTMILREATSMMATSSR